MSALPPFTHVVPLGASCRLTYQLRRCSRSVAGYPFDWWITPLDGLTRYLETPDPDRIFAADALAEEVSDGHIQSIVSREFGFSLFHDFPRVQVGRPTRVVSPDWRESLPAVRARHLRRLERLLALNAPGHRVLFVRHRGDLPTGACESAVSRLWQVLETRWRRADVRLLLMNVPGAAPVGDHIRSISVGDAPGPGAEAWRGDDREWASAFERLGLALVSDAMGPVAPSPDEPD